MSMKCPEEVLHMLLHYKIGQVSYFKSYLAVGRRHNENGRSQDS